MRVLVLCGARGIPLYGPSGASAHVRAMSRAWTNRGAQVTVATPLDADHRGHWGALPAVREIHAAPRTWPRRLQHRGERWDARRLVRNAVSAGPPDLIWERHTLFCDAGRRLAERLQIPRIVELNAPLSIERPGLRRRDRARALEARNLRSATRVIAVSAWLRAWAIELGCAPEKVLHVPNGTSLVQPGDRLRTRERLGLSGLVIGFAGSCKAFHQLDLIPQILDHLPQATALIVGDGPQPPPPHPRLRHLRRVPEDTLADLISAMDVGLSTGAPDHPWRCPLKILDYRAQGVPVVASDVGDARSLLPDGECVRGRNPGVWAAAVLRSQQRSRTPSPRTWDAVLETALVGL